MQKDVIYIDVEDDITAIISKVKASKEKIVALVPPKRIGVLQSAVNLRLLARTADGANKRLVLITGNAALGSLAASAKIPVAKNLQSKPEIIAAPAAKAIGDDDVIDGEDVPASSGADDDDVIVGAVPPSKIEGLDIDGEKDAPAKPASARKTPAKKGIKVPDFGTFRKKAFLLAGLGIFLIAFLVWAIWFAPHATVVISAKTTDRELSVPVTVGASVTTDVDQQHLQSIEKQSKATQTIEFEATGKKNVGEKATGTVKFSQQSLSPATVAAGTQLTATDGHVYVTNGSASIPASTFGPGCFPVACPGTASVGITATNGGAEYNGASGTVTGTPSGVTAQITGSTSGGTDKMAVVVLQADVEKAKAQLAEQNADAEKTKLKDQFDDKAVVIDSSFKVTGGDPQSSPAIGQEVASGKAKLTQETTYTMVGIDEAQLKAYLDEALKSTLTDDNEQKVYDNGLSTVKFSEFAQNDGSQAGTVNLEATAQIGPKIDDSAVKEMVKGKRYGEIEGDLKAIDGVSGVEVKLSPFWVQAVPDDIKKITVDFKLLKNDG